MKLGRILGFVVVMLLAAQTAKAEMYFFELSDDPGMILKSFSPGLDHEITADAAAPAGFASNPATNIPDVGKSNWVFQFDLSSLTGAAPIVSAGFFVTVEGNDDPDLKFGIGHGGASDSIAIGSYLSPNPMATYSMSVEDFFDGVPFYLDVTAGLQAAIDADADFYRFALSANPESQELFTSASFYGPLMEVETVPEPSTLALFGLGAVLVGVIRIRRRK